MSSSLSSYNTRRRRSTPGTEQSPTVSNKRAKVTPATEVHDIVTSNVDHDCNSDSDVDINDAVDEEDEPLQDVHDVTSRSIQSRTVAVFQALGLEGLYEEKLSFLETLLNISTIHEDTRTALAKFREICLSASASGHLGRSTEPTDAFLDKELPDWACNDSVITELWNELVENLVRLGIRREDLVKPSGPIGAILAILWHYPTYNTRHPAYGNVADPSNFSLAAQHRKAGASDSILTVDRHPMRHVFVERGVKWEEEYPVTWDEIDGLVNTFVRTVLSFSKVLIFVGNENARTWKNLITMEPGDRWGVASVSSGTVPSTIFGNVPGFFMLKNNLGEIKKLVFISYHSQHFMHTNNLAAGGYTDLIWNAALDFCGLEIRQADGFIEMIGSKAKPKSWWACFYVDPVTGKRCYEVRGTLKTLKRHWDCHHGKTPDVVWDSTKASNVDYRETPAELRINEWVIPTYAKKWKRNEARWQTIQAREAREALAMASAEQSGKDLARLEKQEAHLIAEKERLLRLSKDDFTIKGSQRTGRQPANLDQRRARCPFIDPASGQECCVTYSTIDSLKHMHFKTKHPNATWDASLVKWVTESEMEWQTSTMAAPKITTAREALSALSVNSRSAKAKEKAKALYIFVCQVDGCSYTNACHASNFKNHVLKEHPHLAYSPDLKSKVLKKDYPGLLKNVLKEKKGEREFPVHPGIYIRVYPKLKGAKNFYIFNSLLPESRPTTGVYIGQISPGSRWPGRTEQHERNMVQNKLAHYKLANSMQVPNSHFMTPILTINENDPAVLNLGIEAVLDAAELTLVSLFRSWHPIVLGPDHNMAQTSAHYESFRAAKAFNAIMDTVKVATQWSPSQIVGCNFMTPMISGKILETLWCTWYDSEKRCTIFRSRRRVRLRKYPSGEFKDANVTLSSSIMLYISRETLGEANITESQTVYVVVEFTDEKDHDYMYVRFPRPGPNPALDFLRTMGIIIEWVDENGKWWTALVTRSQIWGMGKVATTPGKGAGTSDSYRQGLGLASSLLCISWDNAPNLLSAYSLSLISIKRFMYNHMKQTITVEAPKTSKRPWPQNRTMEQNKALILAEVNAQHWDVEVGTRPARIKKDQKGRLQCDVCLSQCSTTPCPPDERGGKAGGCNFSEETETCNACKLLRRPCTYTSDRGVESMRQALQTGQKYAWLGLGTNLLIHGEGKDVLVQPIINAPFDPALELDDDPE